MNHQHRQSTGRGAAWIFILAALGLSLACGVLEQVPTTPDATRQAQQTAQAMPRATTQMAASTQRAAENAFAEATISVLQTARARELGFQLTALSAELKLPAVESTGVPWLTRWLTNPACQPPCWENITPGVTLIDEAIKTVYQYPGVQIMVLPGMSGGEAGTKILQWEFTPAGYGWARAAGGQETVTNLMLATSSDQHLLLGEVIATYGEPSAMVQGSCHGRTCIYSLVYTHRGMELDIGTHDPDEVDIQADSEVSAVHFYPLAEPRLSAAGLDWAGYGVYDFSDR